MKCQPTDTRKGRMWYDLKMNDWDFEADHNTGAQIALRTVQIGLGLPATRIVAANVHTLAHERTAALLAAIP